MKRLTKIINRQLGITLKEFCEQRLKSEYKSFQFRLRENKNYPAEVLYICWSLGVSCQDAFGKPYTEVVMFQGKNEIPEVIRKIWDKADGEERSRLLTLIGIEASLNPAHEFTAEEVAIAKEELKPIPVVKPVPLVIQAPAPPPKELDDLPDIVEEKESSNDFDFFQDVEKKKEEQVTIHAPKVVRKKRDPLEDLFQETY